MDQLQLSWPPTPMEWKEAEVKWLKDNYSIYGQRACAKYLGRSLASIRAKASRLRLRQDQSSIFFKEWQSRAATSKVGKKRPAQALVIKRLHADGKMQMSSEGKNKVGAAIRQRCMEGKHPRGMAGKKHKAEALEMMSAASCKMWANQDYVGNQEAHRQELSDRMMLMQKNGILRNAYSRGRQGKRSDLDDRYFRSAWEANFARYLNFLIKNKNIVKWEYEADTFWFENIKRGCRSYMPDFKVWEKDDSVPYYIEVKGWMDQKSQTKLNRMKKYYPHVRIDLVQKKEYNAIKNSVKMFIDGWE